jgi:hypothetical protein
MEATMAKLSAGFFTRLSVGLAATAQIAAALENDGKIDKQELIGILTTVTTGFGINTNLGGLTITPSADGGLDIHIPAGAFKALG